MSNSNEQFERDFESFLKDDDSRLAALYRKLPRPEPDAQLDATVLAMARRAAAATPPVRARRPRWLPALSAAAVVALAAGVAFRMSPQSWLQRDRGAAQKLDESTPVSAQPPAPVETPPAGSDLYKEKDASAPKPAALPAEPVSSPAQQVPAKRAVPAAGYAAQAQMKQQRETPRKAENAAKPAPAQPQAFPIQEESRQEQKSVERARTDKLSAPASGMLAPPPEATMRDEKAAAPATPMSLPAREAPVAAEKMAAPPAAPPPPPASAAPPTLETQAAGAAAADSMLAAPAPAAKAAKIAPRSKDPNASLYPEHWLANIRTLLRENKRDEALRSLAEFRKMYPDYHLPDDLRDLK